MNKVTLIGNLVRDIELKNYKSEDGIGSYTQFTLALNEYNYKSRENVATFISVVSFGKQAEILAKYAVKGRKMCIEGKG